MVSYCVNGREQKGFAQDKWNLRYDKFPVSIHDEAKMDIDLAKYLLLLSFYRQ